MSTNKIEILPDSISIEILPDDYLSDIPESFYINDSNTGTIAETSSLKNNPNKMMKSLLNKTSEIVYLCAMHENYNFHNGKRGNFEEVNFVIVDKKYAEGIYDKCYILYSSLEKYENIRVPTVVIGNKGYEDNYLKLLQDKSKNSGKKSRSILNADYQYKYGTHILRFDNAQYHCTFPNQESFEITAQIFLNLNKTKSKT